MVLAVTLRCSGALSMHVTSRVGLSSGLHRSLKKQVYRVESSVISRSLSHLRSNVIGSEDIAERFKFVSTEDDSEPTAYNDIEVRTMSRCLLTVPEL